MSFSFEVPQKTISYAITNESISKNIVYWRNRITKELKERNLFDCLQSMSFENNNKRLVLKVTADRALEFPTMFYLKGAGILTIENKEGFLDTVSYFHELSKKRKNSEKSILFKSTIMDQSEISFIDLDVTIDATDKPGEKIKKKAEEEILAEPTSFDLAQGCLHKIKETYENYEKQPKSEKNKFDLKKFHMETVLNKTYEIDSSTPRGTSNY